MKACLVVIAKQPESGKVKTRIAAAIGDDRATDLYRCALQDTLHLARSIEHVQHVLSYAPPTDDGRRYFAHVAADFTLLPQQGTNLGERLNGTFSRLLANYSPVVAIGSDSPDLPAQVIDCAFSVLDAGADVCLGPADDGGYYLIGMRAMQPTLFNDIDWSTEVVTVQTRQRAVDANLRLTELTSWHDLDTVSDLQSLRAPGAPLTRAFVAALNEGER